MPFSGYKDFADCVAKNQDEDDPEAYCGAIQAASGEGKHPALNQSKNNSSSPMSKLDEAGLVAFQMDAKLAVPTLSGNNRRWTEAELKNAAPKYKGKPVMLDHSMNSNDVIGGATEAYWGSSRVRPDDKAEALRAHSIGVMSKELFEKARTDGKGVLPTPILKGISIGGSADPIVNDAGEEVPMNFIPEEYSLTPFPGIKEAEIERLVPLYESLRKKKETGKSVRVTEAYKNLPEFIPVF